MESSSDTTTTTNNDMPVEARDIKLEMNEDSQGKSACDYTPMSGHSVSQTYYPDSSIRLDAMKTTLHDKGSQLSSVWNELYNLLGEYQAELFSKEGELLVSKSKYEGISDIEQLKADLIQKDAELKEVKERLSSIESRSETVQLDLSVKNSLLKKYQQDLLEKEASLLALQSTNKKLESRIQVLETKVTNQTPDHRSSLIGRTLSEARAGSGLYRHTAAGFKRRNPSSSLLHVSTDHAACISMLL